MSKTPFKPIDQTKKLPQMEEEVLKFWEENQIFEKSVENRKKDDDSNRYSFFDGPPFATGLPHYGHMVGTIVKDVIPRYWTMKGKYIPRKWGWDCHGLPIENIVEKELGSKTKKEIEELGVDKFNELCRSKVLEYAGEWEKIIPRLGRWADMKNPYKTMDKDFMESVWWVFKQLWDKDLIYYNYRSMHICPRCETTLSQSEVSEGYQDVKDLSVIAKFKLDKGQKINGELVDDNTHVLAWTTTPWTLPGNVALAVGKDIDYTSVRIKGIPELLIVASNKLEEVFKDQEIEIVHDDMKGSDLVGLKYKPLWDLYANDEKLENGENGWQVVDADFVTTDEGTGVVHIAPAFGEDDMNLGKEKNLPFVQHVAMNGVIDEKVEAIGGLNVKPIDNPQATDVEVIKYLAGKGLLFDKEKYEHSYPHCWRCDTPLINYATGSWFVAVTKIKDKLLENAKDIHWVPEHIKEGRWGNWLEGGRDWSISRQRFWASVMPIWRCQGTESKVESQMSNGGCGNTMVFGSVAELKDASGVEVDDLHKHVVDKITFKCEECGGEMHRVPDVLDTWFDSGSMPYGQKHYPFDNKEEFEKSFPADFIAEGIDQTRAWFYYLHIIAGGIFDSKAFQNVIVNGIVLAEDGQKMSKKLQNYPDPMEMVNKYGADPLRLYLAQSPVVNAQDLNFSEKDLAEIARGTFRMLWQSYSFFVMYANIDLWSVESRKSSHFAEASQDKKVESRKNILDKWIISELHQLIKDVNEEMESYHLMQATRKFAPFVDNLSNWYIRRSRRRFWKSENDSDKNEAYATLHYVLVELSKTIAPFAPFIAEEIYTNLQQAKDVGNVQDVEGVEGEKFERSDTTSEVIQRGDSRSDEATADSTSEAISVHLQDYPTADETLIDTELNKQMKFVRDIISEGLKLRARTQIKVRQPLKELKVESRNLPAGEAGSKVGDEFVEIIKEELNIKNVTEENFDFNEKAKNMSEVNGIKIMLDTEITEELKLEGQAREVIRAIQQMRKEADYQLDDRMKVGYDGLLAVFDKFGDLIAKETLADELKSGELSSADLTKEVKIDEEKLILTIKR